MRRHEFMKAWLRVAGDAGWLTPWPKCSARCAKQSAGTRAGAVGDRAVDGRRAEPVGDVRPAPGTKIAGGTRAIDTAPAGRATGRGLPAPGRANAVDLARALAGEQGRRPRARHVPGQDRLPARSDGRASVDRRDLLPRVARRAGRRFRGTSRSCPASGPRAAASWATSTTPSRRTTRPRRCPTSRRASPKDRASSSGWPTWTWSNGPSRAGARGNGRRHAAPRDGRAGPAMMTSRAAEGVRRRPGAGRGAAEPTATRRSAAAAWRRGG